MKKLKKLSFIFGFMSCMSVNLNAQIQEGGRPKSFYEKVKPLTEIPFVIMPSFDVKAMIREDSVNFMRTKIKPMRFAKGFDVSYSLNNSGLWETLGNGDRLWRLGIKSKGAYSLNIIFTQYDIPDGAKVFIYNKDTSMIIGAFTSKNNMDTKVLATRPVAGEEIIIEYYEPKNVYGKGLLTIGKVSHDYKGILKSSHTGWGYGTSDDCEIDINCPEGNAWQNEKNAVCIIIFNGDVHCTASLINNTKQDASPYLLTANHCICNQDAASTVVALFNYESPACPNGSGDGANYPDNFRCNINSKWGV